MSFYSKSPLLLNEKRNLGNGVNIAGFEYGIYWLKKLLQYIQISTVRGSGAIEKYEVGYDNQGLYTLDIKKKNSKTTT